MNPSLPILIFDDDDLFREGLRNFLLAAGYQRVDVAATPEEAMVQLTALPYPLIFFGISRDLSRGRRLVKQARRICPAARIFPLINAEHQPFIDDEAFEYIIKESVFSSILELASETGGKP
jgi:PleD family two-component response regulator